MSMELDTISFFDSNTRFQQKPSEGEVVDFLFEHLDQYGDPKEQIQLCMDYALERENKAGGFILVAMVGDRIAGATIINKTGMQGYIPANILVYIAVDSAYRGQGIGAKLMDQAIDRCEGGLALHVEPDNPARRLYERMGFSNKYLEMRHV